MKVTEFSYNDLDPLEKLADNRNIAAEYAYYPDGVRLYLFGGDYGIADERE